MTAAEVTRSFARVAIPVARPEAARLAIELVSGVELTTEHEGRELHVLGLFVRDNDEALTIACRGLREARSTNGAR